MRTPQQDRERDMLDPEYRRLYEEEEARDNLRISFTLMRKKFGLLRTLWLIVKQL